MAATNLLYADSLVEVTEDAILFKDYYFPTGSKRVPFSDIEAVTAAAPSWWNGKYRIQGTSDLRTWFPKDWHRPSRSEIFFAKMRGSRRRIGFTVETPAPVEAILRAKALLPAMFP